MVEFVMETIDKTLKYYSKKLNYIKTIELPKELIDDIVKRADNMSGCFGADYINHKIYTYLIDYAYYNDVELPDCYVDIDELNN